MSIPDYESIMLPLLKSLADQKEHSLRETINSLSMVFKLSEEEKDKLFPSGNDIVFNNSI